MMSNELQTIPETFSAVEIRAQVNLVQEVMRAVMKKDEHYGVFPGTTKPSLYKSGAEKLLVTFRIAPEPIVEDLSSADCRRYRVTVKGTSIITGRFVGSGIGECSSDEEKFKWRAAVCDDEFDATPEDRKRIKYKRSGDKIRQVRTSPDDLANTVLKMAKKRAYVDLALTATGASDLFNQDLEDLPEEVLHTASDRPKIQPAQPRAASPAPAATKGEYQEATFVPEGYTEKKGETNGKSWVKIGIKDSSGRWFGSFDSKVGDLLKSAQDDGRAVRVVFKSDGKYNNITQAAYAEDIPEG